MPLDRTTICSEEIAARSALLAHLDRADIGLLVAASQTISVTTGQHLFSKDDPSDAAFIILSGEVAIEILSEDGRCIRIASLGQADSFGEIGVLDGGVRTADARALSPAKLLMISKRKFNELFAMRPAFALSIVRELASKIRGTDNQLTELSFKSLRARLALLLLDLAKDEDGAKVLRITQTELAERLSATREKVNVNLQNLKRVGSIAISRGRILVVDEKRLKEIGLR